METYILEAVFLFYKTNYYNQNFDYDFEETNNNITLNIRENVFQAIIRILVANNLINYSKNKIYINQNQKEYLNQLVNSIKRDEKLLSQCESLFIQSNQNREYFFAELNEIEYEIYSRENFNYSYHIGLKLVPFIDFSEAKILDVGGNSGGLATAIAINFKSAQITVVDTAIPCYVGNEFRVTNAISNISFVESDFFDFELDRNYDYVLLSNILHDFSDEQCITILKQCKKHGEKILIIEDVLKNDFSPIEILSHGLRMAINVKDGRQRTQKQIKKLLSLVEYKTNKIHHLSEVHSFVYGENQLKRSKSLC